MSGKKSEMKRLTIILFLYCCGTRSLANRLIPGQRVSYLRLTLPDEYHNVTNPDRKYVPDTNDAGPLIRQGLPLFHETLFQQSQGHFNRERIPERVVHAKGSTFFGHFRVTNGEIERYTKASLFGPVGKQTPLVARFSTQLGEKGSPDTPFGEVRGLGVKFYTDQGNFDLLCINLPVFFINDPQLFVHLNHAQKRDPRSNLRNSDNLWDFFSFRPEAYNAISYVYSEYGMPNGFRHMPAFSVNTFRLVNKNGQRYYARFMFLPESGIENLNISQSFHLAGQDPDYARRDLFESIENHHRPSWTLYMQTITIEEVEDSFAYNPFDTTKLWPLDRFPGIEVGIMTLDRNVANAFAEDEQLALNPANLVPGIEPSPDRLLRGRFFAYLDTQFYRLGANHMLIPVNRNAKNVLSERDGSMRTDANLGPFPNYYPNSRFKDQPHLYNIIPAPFSFDLDEIIVLKPDSIQQHYLHARETYYSFTVEQRNELHHNLAFALNSVTKQQILDRVLGHFDSIHPEYGHGIRLAMMKLRSRTPK